MAGGGGPRAAADPRRAAVCRVRDAGTAHRGGPRLRPRHGRRPSGHQARQHLPGERPQRRRAPARLWHRPRRTERHGHDGAGGVPGHPRLHGAGAGARRAHRHSRRRLRTGLRPVRVPHRAAGVRRGTAHGAAVQGGGGGSSGCQRPRPRRTAGAGSTAESHARQATGSAPRQRSRGARAAGRSRRQHRAGGRAPHPAHGQGTAHRVRHPGHVAGRGRRGRRHPEPRSAARQLG